MTMRKASMTAVTIGCVFVAQANVTFKIMSTKLSTNNGVAVTEIRVGDEVASSVKEVSVPVGSDVTVTFGRTNGYIWGNPVAVYANVTTNMTIVSAPDSVRAYKGLTAKPILILYPEDLVLLRQIVADGETFLGRHFRQMADLDMSSLGPWSPIGSSTAFQGTYQGNGCRIDNLTLAPGLRTGLFGYVSKGTIRDLTVHFAGFENPKNETCGGAIVANASTSVKFIHVVAEGTLAGVSNPSAGIAVAAGSCSLSGCTNRVNLSGSNTTLGGLVALSSNVPAMPAMTYADCANEGSLRLTDQSGVAGGLVGVVSGSHQATFTRCVNLGANVSGGEAGSLVGHYVPSSTTSITAVDCMADVGLPPIGGEEAGARAVTGLDFARVIDSLALFCPVPTAAGSYRVMLANADSIVLTGAQVGDKLILDNYSAYTGTVSCDNAELSVVAANGVWTVSSGTSVDGGTIIEGSEPGVYDFQPTNGQTSVVITGFSGDVLRIPGSLSSVRGLDKAKIAIVNGGYDVTAAVTFADDGAGGYGLSLNGSAVVNDVKVTPTIGSGVSDAFTLAGGTRITIQAIPGLWYGLLRGTSPSVIDELCEVKMAEEDSVALTDGLTALPGGYYRIRVELADFTPAE